MKNSFFSCFLLLLLFGFGCRASHPKPSAAQRVNLSERLAKIKMTDLKGKSFTLQDMDGKPVFLNFWATWCGPCVSEMEHIETVYQQFKNDVVFLAVSNEDPAKIKAFLEKHDFHFKFAHLDIDYIDAYVVTMPTTMLISGDGQLKVEEEGYRIWTQPGNIEKVKSLLVQK